MNKKNLFILLAVMSFYMAGMSGCSDEKEERMPQMTTAAVNNYETKDTDITVTGEVTEITGNRVTLALGTLSENNNSSPGRNDDSGSDFPQMPEGERPDFGSGEMPDGGFGREKSGRDGSGFEKGSFGENNDFGMDGDRAMGGDRKMGGGRRGGASIDKSGDEGTYIIPVGMPIDGLSGRNSDYSVITVGTILTLTVNEDGVVCAASAE